METKLRRDLRIHRAYTLVSTTALAVLILTAFKKASPAPQRFGEIDVERINVVESDGTLRMVIANRTRSPAAVSHGRTYGPPGERPGIIFYNDEGGEHGGLIWGGERNEDGYGAGASLTFDQFDQDQVVALQYIDDNGQRSQGLTVLDRPDLPLADVIDEQERIRQMPAGPEREAAQRAWIEMQGGVPFGAPRVFVGRAQDRSAVLQLSDPQGRPRVRLSVDSVGVANLDFLDDRGAVVAQFP